MPQTPNPPTDPVEFDRWLAEFETDFGSAAKKLGLCMLEGAMRRAAGHPPSPVQLTGEEAAALSYYLCTTLPRRE